MRLDNLDNCDGGQPGQMGWTNRNVQACGAAEYVLGSCSAVGAIPLGDGRHHTSEMVYLDFVSSFARHVSRWTALGQIAPGQLVQLVQCPGAGPCELYTDIIHALEGVYGCAHRTMKRAIPNARACV